MDRLAAALGLLRHTRDYFSLPAASSCLVAVSPRPTVLGHPARLPMMREWEVKKSGKLK